MKTWVIAAFVIAFIVLTNWFTGYVCFNAGKKERVQPLVIQLDDANKMRLKAAFENIGVLVTEEQWELLPKEVLKQQKKPPVGFKQ